MKKPSLVLTLATALAYGLGGCAAHHSASTQPQPMKRARTGSPGLKPVPAETNPVTH